MDGWIDEWMDRWMDGWMNGWTDGQIDRQTDGWMDGSIYPIIDNSHNQLLIYIHTCIILYFSWI